VPGDHFTMMRQHAGSTALAVQEWLAETLPEQVAAIM
jgi:hypothetical protein